MVFCFFFFWTRWSRSLRETLDTGVSFFETATGWLELSASRVGSSIGRGVSSWFSSATSWIAGTSATSGTSIFSTSSGISTVSWTSDSSDTCSVSGPSVSSSLISGIVISWTGKSFSFSTCTICLLASSRSRRIRSLKLNNFSFSCWFSVKYLTPLVIILNIIS